MVKTNDAWEILMADLGGDLGILDGVHAARLQAEAGMAAYKLREDAGLSQAELAAKMNVPVAAIDDFEMGDVDSVDGIAFLRQIAAVTSGNVEGELAAIQRRQIEAAI